MSGEKGGQGSKKRAPEHIADEQTIKTPQTFKNDSIYNEIKISNNWNKSKEKMYINKSL